MREECRRLFATRLAGPRVLEIGCGPGNDSQAFAKRGLDVTATDAVRGFVEIVRRRFPALRVLRMDMTHPAIRDALLDGIYGFASFLHLPRSVAPATLLELRRLLRPRGVLFLTLISSTKVREYTIPDWGGKPDNPVLFTCYGEDEIRGLLAAAGFQATEIFRVTSPVYETMPRLVERGVSGFQVSARA